MVLTAEKEGGSHFTHQPAKEREAGATVSRHG